MKEAPRTEILSFLSWRVEQVALSSLPLLDPKQQQQQQQQQQLEPAKVSANDNDNQDTTCQSDQDIDDTTCHYNNNNNNCYYYWLIRPTNDDLPLQVHVGATLPTHLVAGVARQVYLLSGTATRTGRRQQQQSPKNDNDDNDDNDKNTTAIGTKRLYRDAVVQIWEFRLAPNQACRYHVHTHPYLFLNLTESWNQELDPQGNLVPNTLPARQVAGQCTAVPRELCGAHAVRNVGDAMFWQFIVEFLE